MQFSQLQANSTASARAAQLAFELWAHFVSISPSLFLEKLKKINKPFLNPYCNCYFSTKNKNKLSFPLVYLLLCFSSIALLPFCNYIQIRIILFHLRAYKKLEQVKQGPEGKSNSKGQIKYKFFNKFSLTKIII